MSSTVSEETLLHATSGTVRGVTVDGVRTFLGVPYGSADRFGAPRPARTWTGVRDAVRHGPSARQRSTTGGEAALAVWGGIPEKHMDEDCLCLNLWAPAEEDAADEALPVLVYLHGGGHGLGSGAWPVYDGTRLARRGDVVVVTINHRLGVLGYLDLSHVVGPEFATSGINGILDIVEALRWIRANIGGVGGDPHRVLVYGQSGGGSKTAALLAVPSSYGLYSAACMMSTSEPKLRSPDEAGEFTEQLLAHLGLRASDVEQLVAIPPQRLIEATDAIGDSMTTFQPVRDKTWAVGDPADAIAGRIAPDIPLLIGTTRDEMARLGVTPVPPEADDDWVAEQIRPLVGVAARDIVAGYRDCRPTASPRQIQIAIANDMRFLMGSIELAEARLSAGGAPVWMYRFDWETAVSAFAGTAPHGGELGFFFDNVDLATSSAVGPGWERLAAQCSSMVVSLAARGTPAHEALPPWPAYDAERRNTMLLDVESRVADDPAADARRIWSTRAVG